MTHGREGEMDKMPIILASELREHVKPGSDEENLAFGEYKTRGLISAATVDSIFDLVGSQHGLSRADVESIATKIADEYFKMSPGERN